MTARELRHALLGAFSISLLFSLPQASVADDSQLATKSSTVTTPKADPTPEFGIKQPPQKMSITASQISGDSKLFKFIGNVVVIDEGMELTADRLFVHRNEMGETTKLVATTEKNDVVFKSSGGMGPNGKKMEAGEASGKTLVYDMVARKMTLSGTPILKYADGSICKGAEKVLFTPPPEDSQTNSEWEFDTEGGKPTIIFPRDAGLFQGSKSSKKQ